MKETKRSEKTELVYECVVNPRGCQPKVLAAHPSKDPICCGVPMKKAKDSCCDPLCGPSTCGS